MIEALARSVPVVEPDHAGLTEVVNGTGGGVLCAPRMIPGRWPMPANRSSGMSHAVWRWQSVDAPPSSRNSRRTAWRGISRRWRRICRACSKRWTGVDLFCDKPFRTGYFGNSGHEGPPLLTDLWVEGKLPSW